MLIPRIASKEFSVLTFAIIFQIVVLFAAPISVGFWFNRRWGLSWALFFGGALSFVLAWVITSLIQLNNESALIISSITEMGVLYLIYRTQLKTVKTEREALMVGVGLAGIELILMSFLVLLSLLQMRPLRNATDEAIISLAARIQNVSEEEVESGDIDELRDIIDDYWNRPGYEPILQVAQPLTFLSIQMGLAVITLGAVTQNNIRPLLGAMAIHFLTRVIPAYGAMVGGFILAIGLSLLFGGIALWFLYKLWPVVQQQNTVAHNARKLAKQTKSVS
jgi:uncharacterized membrane protein YhfC